MLKYNQQTESHTINSGSLIQSRGIRLKMFTHIQEINNPEPFVVTVIFNRQKKVNPRHQITTTKDLFVHGKLTYTPKTY